MTDMGIRLQKYIADAGRASRRNAEVLIASGHVKVNGRVVTEMGVKVSQHDRVEVEGKVVRVQHTKVYIMLNKPAGYVSTSKVGKETGESVLALVPSEYRLYPIGRLDQDTSGLLLLTNDGDLALTLTHPRFEKEKEYEVTIDREMPSEGINALTRGVRLADGEVTLPTKVEMHGKRMFTMILKEGKNRQIRRMCGAIGVGVTKLHRVRVNKLSLGSLPLGKWRMLNPDEVKALGGTGAAAVAPVRSVAPTRSRFSRQSNRREHGYARKTNR